MERGILFEGEVMNFDLWSFNIGMVVGWLVVLVGLGIGKLLIMWR